MFSGDGPTGLIRGWIDIIITIGKCDWIWIVLIGVSGNE